VGKSVATVGVTAGWHTTRAPGSRTFGAGARELLSQVGINLFDWQAEVLNQWLEVDANDRLLRQTGVLICPRRNGKTALIAARCLLGMLHLGELRITYSSHRMDTSQEVFTTMVQLLETPLLRDYVKHIYRAHGKEAITLTNGARFSIRTRTSSGGRGLETDLLVLDEALELSDDSVAALVPLTAKASAQGRGQVLYASSAGHAESLVLIALRDRGRELAGTPGGGIAYHEFGAERDAPIDDVQTWWDANPSLGTAILTEDFLRNARARMSAEAFGREHLGWWSDTGDLPVIDPAEWAALAIGTPPEPADGIRWAAFDIAPELTMARLLVFYRDEQGRIIVACVDSVNEPDGIDVDAYGRRLLGLLDTHQPEVVGYDKLTGSYPAQLLAGHGWKDRLRHLTGAGHSSGLHALVSAVKTGQIRHDGHPDVAEDLERATGKPFADGGRVFSRKTSEIAGPIPSAVALAAGMYAAGDKTLGLAG
jgi:hypothetical protein